MADKHIRSLVYMYEQQVDHLPFDIKTIATKLNNLQNIDKWAYILHDKDINAEAKAIAPHYHIVLTFKKRIELTILAKSLQDNVQQFEIMTKRGTSAKSSANNAFAYLIHATSNSREKFQYSSSEVIANFDFVKFIDDQSQVLLPQDILDLVIDGSLDKDSALTKLAQLGGTTLARYTKKIDDVWHAYLLIEHKEWLAKKNQKKDPIRCIWLFGKAGTGKTRYATDISTRHKWSYFKSKSSNDPFENYAGESVLILDELRPNSLAYSDLLQILDPYQYEKTTVARYHNAPIQADIIFITSPYGPIEFYSKIKGIDAKIDNFNQLRRRLSTVVEFNDGVYQELAFKNIKANSAEYEVKETHKNPYSKSNTLTNFFLSDLENYQ